MSRIRPAFLVSLAASGALLASVLLAAPAMAADPNDHTAPTILSVQADRATAVPGETVRYRIEFSDENPRTSDMRPTRGAITNLLQFPYYWDAANPASSPRDELEPTVSREQVEQSVRSIGVDAAGQAAFAVTVDVKVPDRAWYGKYHWNAGSLAIYDENANAVEVVLPDFIVDDPSHPVGNVVSTSLAEGTWRAKYVLPGAREYGSSSAVFFGDTVTATLDAPGASLSYAWVGSGNAPAGSRSMSPSVETPVGIPVSVEVTATWPDGVKRVRDAAQGYTTALMIPARSVATQPVTTGAIGTFVAPNFSLNPDAELLVPGITKGLKTSWWRPCGGGICQDEGSKLFLLSGDDSSYGVTFSINDERAAAHPMVYLRDLPRSEQVVVTPGSVTTPRLALGAPTVLKPLHLDVSGFTGASSVRVTWESASRGSVATQVVTTSATLTPSRYMAGDKLRVHAVATYANGATSAKVTSPWVTVAAAKQTLRVPTITGTPTVGSTLKASVSKTGLASGNAVSWQWYRGSSAIKNAAGSSYKLAAGDLKAKVWVKATATAQGYAKTSSNSASVTVKAGTIVKGKVSVKGTAKVKRQLTASLSTWKSGNSYSFQWTKNGKTIKGATSPRYTTKLTDRGAKIAVKVTAKRAGCTAVSVTSPARVIARR
jgi:hypothetical protein